PDINRINKNFAELEAGLIKKLKADGFPPDKVKLTRYIEMRYRRQVNGIFCPVPGERLKVDYIGKLIETFDTMYEQQYGKGTAYREAGIEATTFRIVGIGPMSKPPLKKYPPGKADASGALKGQRDVYFSEYKEMRPCNIYEYDLFMPGNSIQGPAIVESPDTTVVIHPNQSAVVDDYLNIILHLGRR
ncbi:MAG: hypothetical protein U1D67_09080, partial [Dehalococcoidia bacterium]|nr:hypothetical protein [Dehalococcoidia bacterium]